METVPKRIYLTTGDDGAKVTGDAAEVTWCQDRITEHDVEYVRADIAGYHAGQEDMRRDAAAKFKGYVLIKLNEGASIVLSGSAGTETISTKDVGFMQFASDAIAALPIKDAPDGAAP